tara:strand:+ start:2324 stop:2584 length:261 start_codon:yes stop_codon:yes gene_type:complete
LLDQFVVFAFGASGIGGQIFYVHHFQGVGRQTLHIGKLSHNISVFFHGILFINSPNYNSGGHQKKTKDNLTFKMVLLKELWEGGTF